MAVTQDEAVQIFVDRGYKVEHLDNCVILRGEPSVSRDGKQLVVQALAFSGKRGKYDFYFSFRSVVAREAHITEYIESLKRREAYKIEARANRREAGQVGAARMIRAELKTAFPGIVFSVTSESFSMGDAVHISWTDGPTDESVEKITSKYQYGHFDGMTDMYEDSNVRKDIPQSKWVNTSRHMSDAVRSTIKAEISERFRIDMDDEKKVFEYFGYWPDSVIRKEFSKREFAAVRI